MTAITAAGEGRLRVRAPLAEVFALLLQVERVGLWWPGVERIEPLGDGRYRWTNLPRRAVGKTFQSEYTAEYRNNGRDEITFASVAGNTDTQGVWRLRPAGDATEITVEVTSTVEMPLPSLVRKPAELFARREVNLGIAAQLERIRETLERG